MSGSGGGDICLPANPATGPGEVATFCAPSSPCGKVSVPGDGRGASRACLVPESPALRPGVQGPRLAPPPSRLPTPRRSWPSRMWLLGGRCQLGLSFAPPPQRARDSPKREHVRVPGVGHVPARGDVRQPRRLFWGCLRVQSSAEVPGTMGAPGRRRCLGTAGGCPWGEAGSQLGPAPLVRCCHHGWLHAPHQPTVPRGAGALHHGLS